MTKILLCLTGVVILATLTSAQVGAPNLLNSKGQAQRIERAVDGKLLLRGNVQVAITSPVELRADEIDISPDGREMV
jgi:hypothetical protein